MRLKREDSALSSVTSPTSTFSRKGARFPPVERTLRLSTGLILFTFAASHFLNHACGIFRLPAMEAVRFVLLWPWRTLLGQTLLYGSFLIHGGLGLYAIYRRRHLQIPRNELFQILLGLSIPPLVILHAVNVRLGYQLFDLPLSYPWLIYRYWELSPFVGLPRQFLLLLILWIHGCIGLRSWLRFRPWYPAWTPVLASLATLVPILAMSGIIAAGRDFDATAAQDAAFRGAFARMQTPAEAAALAKIGETLILIYLGLVGAVFAARAALDWRRRRYRAIAITYPDGARAIVPRGFSILEASRWAGTPHMSMCGGRGRCSTCRVRIGSGLAALPSPNVAEANTLAAIGAPADVRLACQLRPIEDVDVTPLLTLKRWETRMAASRPAASNEHEIVALFVDLRDSTRLADGRLPYDAFYVIDKYVGAVCKAVESQSGEVTSVAGDGVMCFFDGGGDPRAAARRAMIALRDIWIALAELSVDFEAAFDFPIRFGAGCHVGIAIVGGLESRHAIQFLGEVGNIAARLQALTKEAGCAAILSRAVIERAGLPVPALERRRVQIRSVSQEIETVAFRAKEDFTDLIGHQAS
ncbi:adenylate/guanylate cyclase domain-containing protein [Methylocella silvestris]|uniref:Adenylate/guanylate cyclase domain-containing protein n=1 Tax=Methylocella silvestris TaxID=199596 RepID=A0A2J7TJD7_METSI|nr:adenylate/guanylate cyclase domain-containing protein [Methylocella silvestris]